ncbi:MAG: YraN family protein, partial [Ilumatobacteraceae bacterium]
MGVGHVPEEPVRAAGEGAHLQRRQRRGAAADRAVAAHLAVGRAGEDLAAQWYAEHGYEIVERNWRWREGGEGRRVDGEVDIIAVGHGTIVFCEVKSRADDRFGGPLAAVTRQKQERLR